jgi:hypothetical protein
MTTPVVPPQDVDARFGVAGYNGAVIEGSPSTLNAAVVETDPVELHAAGAPTNGTNAVHTATVDATDGTMVVEFDGAKTAALAHDVSTANMQIAVRALATVNGAHCTVTGSAGTSYVFTFGGNLGKLAVPLIKVDAAALIKSATVGTATVVETTPGVTATGRNKAPGSHYTNDTTAVEYVNIGTGIAPNWTMTADISPDTIISPTTFIVVGKNGNDTTGIGSFDLPYLTIAKAVSVWTATRHTIYVLAGDYSEVALVWPNTTGLSLIGLGPVSISNSDAAPAVLTVAPTFTASTFEATIKGIGLSAAAQIGLKIANAAMTKKLNVYVDGLEVGADSTGNSVDIAGTVSGQAIRVYATNLDCENLVNFAANNAGSRLRIRNGDLTGGITCSGAVAAEVTLRNVQVLTSGLTVAAEWTLCNIGCVYATDADPAVHSQFADAYAG